MLLLVVLGVVECFGLSDVELVLVCVSYNGELVYVVVVEVMLAKVGFDVAVFECGAYWFYREVF